MSAIIPSVAPIRCAHSEVRRIEQVVEHPRNPNKHPEAQLRILGKVICATGWRSPVVISRRSGFVIKGHGRLQAARLAGLGEVPVDLQDYANEAEEWADMIADNRLAELAEISLPDLKDLLADLDTGAFDMDLTGFDLTALEMLMSQFHAAETAAPALADGDREPFRTMTFVVADAQFERISVALKKAKQAEGIAPLSPDDVENENSNGNALAYICAHFNRG